MENSENNLTETQATKVCSVCGMSLPLDAFKRHNLSADGYTFICKDCTRKNYGRLKKAAASAGNPKLVSITPQEMIDELRYRGYRGKLTYTITKEITL